MPASGFGVVAIGLACLVNLAITLVVVRRLRELGRHLGHRSHDVDAVDDAMEVMTPHDDLVGEFSVTATTGEAVSRAGLSGVTLVGFFSPSCVACKDKLSDFVRRAKRVPGGRAQVVASVMGLSGPGADMVAALEPVARVVVEPDLDPMFMAFEVRTFPAYCLLDESGRVVAKASDVQKLPELAAA